jgi:hypothetical protein
MNHAILKLDNRRAYLLVEHNVFNNEKNHKGEWKIVPVGTDQTWYDTHVSFIDEKVTKVGDTFLKGKITKIISYDDYVKKFPEVTPKFEEVNEETEHTGFIRKVGASRMKTNAYDNWSVETVLYAVNPLRYTMTKLMQSDIV